MLVIKWQTKFKKVTFIFLNSIQDLIITQSKNIKYEIHSLKPNDN